MTNKPFRWEPREDKFYYKAGNKIFDKIALRKGMKKEELNQEFKRRVELLKQLRERKIFRFEEVQDVINEYYKNPVKVLSRFGLQ